MTAVHKFNFVHLSYMDPTPELLQDPYVMAECTAKSETFRVLIQADQVRPGCAMSNVHCWNIPKIAAVKPIQSVPVAFLSCSMAQQFLDPNTIPYSEQDTFVMTNHNS